MEGRWLILSKNLTTNEKADLLKSVGYTPDSDIFGELNKDISVWETPIPFKNVDLPPFPIKILVFASKNKIAGYAITRIKPTI